MSFYGHAENTVLSALIILACIGCAVVVYLVTTGIESSSSVSVEVVGAVVENIEGSKYLITPEGKEVLLKLYVRAIGGRTYVSRVYIKNPNTGEVIYLAKLKEKALLTEGKLSIIEFTIPRDVYNKIVRLGRILLTLSSTTGVISSSYLPSSKIKVVKPTEVLSEFRIVIIKCEDAASWWVNTTRIIEIINEVLRKSYKIELLQINNTEELLQFIESPNDYLGKDWSNAIVINAHGEVVPIPFSYTNNCSTPNWRGWFDKIVSAIKNYGLIWVSPIGYPFFYVSNTKCDNWITEQGRGIFRVGDQGVRYVLNTTDIEFWSGDEWRVMVKNRSYHNFLNNSVELGLTNHGRKFNNEIYGPLLNDKLPPRLTCARALHTTTLAIKLPLYSNNSDKVYAYEVLTSDDFDSDTTDPFVVDPQGYQYWDVSGSYSIANSLIKLERGSRLLRYYVGWNDIYSVSLNNYNIIKYMIKYLTKPLTISSSNYFYSLISNPYGEDIYDVIVKIRVPEVVSGIIPIEVLPNNSIVVCMAHWDCGTNYCDVFIKIPYLPKDGARLILIPSSLGINYDLRDIYIAYEDFSDASLVTNYWELYGDSSINALFGYLVLVHEVGGHAGKVFYKLRLWDSMSSISKRLVIEFRYRFINFWDERADGFVAMFFVDHNTSVPTGGSLGFEGTKGYGVEFDIWRNDFDPSRYHIALIYSSVSNHLAVYNDNPIFPAYLNAFEWHNCRIEVDLKNSVIRVYVDGNKLLEWSGYINITYPYIGFSAATGGAYDEVDIDYVKVYNYELDLGTAIKVNEHTNLNIATNYVILAINSGNTVRYAVEILNSTLNIGVEGYSSGEINVFSELCQNATRDLSSLGTKLIHTVLTDITNPAVLEELLIELNLSSKELKISIGELRATLNLSLLDINKLALGFYARYSEIDIDYAKVFGIGRYWVGPRYCCASVPLGRGFLVFNSLSPPNDVRKEFGYSLSGISNELVARLAVLYPVFVSIYTGS